MSVVLFLHWFEPQRGVCTGFSSFLSLDLRPPSRRLAEFVTSCFVLSFRISCRIESPLTQNSKQESCSRLRADVNSSLGLAVAELVSEFFSRRKRIDGFICNHATTEARNLNLVTTLLCLYVLLACWSATICD